MFCFFSLLNVPLLRDAPAVVRDADDELHPGPPLTLAFVRPPPPFRTIPARADSCISAASRRFFTGERRRETVAAADGGRLTCCFPPEGGSGPRRLLLRVHRAVIYHFGFATHLLAERKS